MLVLLVHFYLGFFKKIRTTIFSVNIRQDRLLFGPVSWEDLMQDDARRDLSDWTCCKHETQSRVLNHVYLLELGMCTKTKFSAFGVSMKQFHSSPLLIRHASS